MTQSQFQQIQSTFTLATGYNLTAKRDENGDWIVRVDKNDGFYIEFLPATALAWARSVYQAHG